MENSVTLLYSQAYTVQTFNYKSYPRGAGAGTKKILKLFHRSLGAIVDSVTALLNGIICSWFSDVLQLVLSQQHQ